MRYKHLKTTSLTLILLFFTLLSQAQSNYYKWSIGFGAGANYSRTDVVRGNWGHTFSGTIDHNFTPFVTVGLEGQFGMIQGGDIYTDRNNRQFVNQYKAINANMKVMLGEFVDYRQSNFLYHIRGLYAGIGVGAIKNNITDIVRIKPGFAFFDAGYGPFPGEDKSVNLWVPLNLGINFYFKDRWDYARYVLTVNAQSNFTFGEGLDGYNDPPSTFDNEAPDTYNVYSIGFKYYFGNIRFFRRTL
ncbi:hypothetical protein [Pedobacter jejuensis]|uniref:Outer membrane protein beta-barrel domain-containing protein n=1 Tax=Pedobacter jejuensis TaxID=1268550 RepID=A0A3N0BUC5_9SPHI|nr:hypothetical protein [Pedobacter jejuensis]RNL52792.1 hypothetical protein D7004_10895 [Pedobacter jejuensis]